MRYYDADSHVQEPFDWLDQVDPDFAAEVPVFRNRLDFKEACIGEIMALVPPDDRPTAQDILPKKFLDAVDRAFEVAESGGVNGKGVQELLEGEKEVMGFVAQKGSYHAGDRLEVNEEIGIDMQIINPSIALTLVESARIEASNAAARQMCEAYNTWITGILAGTTDRLIPTSLIQLDDVDWAVAELRRTHAAGCRAFLPPLNPVDGRTLGDRHYDPIWQTALDIGMLPVLHLGRGEVQLDPTWGKIGGELQPKTYARMAIAQRQLLPQLVLSSMIYGGVFDRFPELVILCEEFGIAWIQSWIDHLGVASPDGAKTFGGMFGWEHERSPMELLQENLRFTPLPGQRVDQVIDLFGPNILMFCTDYPHPEGDRDASEYFHGLLDGNYDDETIEKFFWRNLDELFQGIGATAPESDPVA